MSALILDAGALIALDRNDRAVIAQLEAAQRRSVDLRTSAIVIAQVWRSSAGRQARLARALQGTDIRVVDERVARAAGELLARSGTTDAIDATLVLVAENGDRILTTDVADLRRLVSVAGTSAAVIAV